MIAADAAVPENTPVMRMLPCGEGPREHSRDKSCELSGTGHQPEEEVFPENTLARSLVAAVPDRYRPAITVDVCANLISLEPTKGPASQGVSRTAIGCRGEEGGLRSKGMEGRGGGGRCVDGTGWDGTTTTVRTNPSLTFGRYPTAAHDGVQRRDRLYPAADAEVKFDFPTRSPSERAWD